VNDRFNIGMELGNYTHIFDVDHDYWKLDYLIECQSWSFLVLCTLAFEIVDTYVIKGCLIDQFVLLNV